MEENKTQFYISGKDKPYNIKEAYGGVYKGLRMLTLKYSGADKLSKAAVVKEFKLASGLDADSIVEYLNDGQKDEVDIKEYYESICKILFIEEPTLKFDEINMSEVGRAINVFFTNLNAS